MEPNKRVFAVIIFLLLVVAVLRTGCGPLTEARIPPEQAEEIYAALGGKPGEIPVVAFVTSWCPHCRTLESWLQSQGISYVQADIEKNEQAARFFSQLAGRGAGVPRTIVGPYFIAGDSRTEIQAARMEIQKMKLEKLGGTAR